jgi:hypothetical protein
LTLTVIVEERRDGSVADGLWSEWKKIYLEGAKEVGREQISL